MIETDDEVSPSVLARALERATLLIRDSSVPHSRREARSRRRFRRLFDDPRAVGVTITLTDEVMRFSSPKSASRALRSAVRGASARGFGVTNVVGLRVVAALSRLAPRLAVSVVTTRVRGLTSTLIGDADGTSLHDRLEDHRREGLRVNVNVLGEAVLGEREAEDRLARVTEIMRRPDVDYVSVKLSAIASQLISIDHAGSLERVAAKLRALYRVADAESTFVNLDMEEYRDLRLTLDAFETVLDEAEFCELSAGVVLQAYLPESHAALEELISFATRRVARKGAPIKVRLVKGANLAMEHVEAEFMGGRPPPTGPRPTSTPSYLRLLDVALRPDHAAALRVGVASHNLFHVTWALELADARGVSQQLDVEMLEGMANTEAQSLVESGQPVLLYAPVTRSDDFASAVAYLVRRLDENTAPENYLRAVASIADDPEVFEEQRQRFLDALEARHAISTAPRRRALSAPSGRFQNEPDGDPTDARYVNALNRAMTDVLALEHHEIDTLDHLDLQGQRDFEDGHDPNDGGRSWYRYRVANETEIDRALEFASSGFAAWHGRPVDERRAILQRAAQVMADRRAESIAVMARDGGKIVAEADPEVSEGVDFARHYAALAPSDDPSTPLGVVLVVPPWNFPYSIPAGGVLAALAAGNAVILKPAPEAVAVAHALVRQLWVAGVPRDVLQMIPTRDDDSGRHLVAHVGVSAVLLTGSFETARLFVSWKPSLTLLAETSGKNVMVVTASADIDLAVRDLVHSAFGHAGQKCSAASLAIVERSLYEDPRFIAQLTDEVTSLHVGAGYELSSTVGPIIRPPEPALRHALFELDEGERWLVEPEALDASRLRWRPGVKVGVQAGSWSHLNEWFGPVLGVMVASDLDEAIAWQNQIPYALTGGLHSLSETECERWLERVAVGNLYVDRGTTGAVVRRQPFGGWKRSSVGPTAKTGGAHYVECLRRWAEVRDVDAALREAATWWHEYGGLARDDVGLLAERNLVRYRRPLAPTVVRVDDSFSLDHAAYVRGLTALAGLDVEFSAETIVKEALNVTLESADELAARLPPFTKVRWLSGEVAPAAQMLDHDVRLDTRVLAQAGAVELPRWLLEQSVSITNHRYGNLNAGPKPRVDGLGDTTQGKRLS